MTLNLPPRKEIRELFQSYRLYPSKKLGQNFLIDESVIKKFLKAADLRPSDIVLEIGPGIGNLTQELAKKAKKVIAVEKDPKMCQILEETLKNFNNIDVITGDVLKIPNTKYKIQDTKYKIVANLPFYLTAPVIRKFLEDRNPPEEMILFAQKEVAQRICASPPTKNKNMVGGKPPQMNLLAVLVQFYAKPEIIAFVSKKSFWPQPKVDSAIIRITPISNKYTMVKRLLYRDLFFEIVKAGFSQPRKQILNNLANSLKLDKKGVKNWLLKNKIQPSQRAETLTVKDWINLTKKLQLHEKGDRLIREVQTSPQKKSIA